jgi:hypothetical protein
MGSIKPLLLGGLAAAAIAGVAGIAAAESSKIHTLTVQMPAGGVAHVRYTGDQPPKIVVAEGAAAPMALAPAAFAPDWYMPLAAFDRIFNDMDREAAAFLQQARALEAQVPPDDRRLTALGQVPSGARSYSFVSTASGQGVCGRSVEITSRGAGQPPQVISHTWGDCASNDGAPIAGARSDPAAQGDGALVKTKAEAAGGKGSQAT